MYPLNFAIGTTPNPNTVRAPDDGRPILCDRYCDACLVQWRGEIRDECWSCGETPGKTTKE